jgi:steroid 5-alpha reductase family enzyme
VSAISTVIVVAAVFAGFAWIASLLTGDYSWVDRGWSIVPVVYVWIFAGFAHLANARLDLMAALVTIWGARLTFNFARKGGYSGVEDYRWGVLRSGMSRARFQLFNIAFIVLYQNFLLVLISLPALTALQHRATPLGWRDVVLSLIFVAFTVGETVADQQQWDFQTWKREEIQAGRRPGAQFLQTGLFRYSRHPNFFFEQAQWWTLFLIGAVAAGSVLQMTAAGPILLTALFVGSTSFTERITLSKYPAYARYQSSTSAIVPWFVRTSATGESPVSTD